MQYVSIRGLNISKFTLGTVQLGMEYGIANKSGKPDKGKSFEILETAVSGGINSFDTAEAYGDSEAVLGEFFKSLDGEKPLLTTKFKVASSGDTSSTDIEKQIYGFAEQSLKRLKIRKIPIYMLHNAKDMKQHGSVVPETLKKLKNEGLIEKAAVSVYTPDDAEEVLENDIYEAIQVPMNIFDNSMIKRGVLKKLREADIIVFVRSIFLQGLFFLKPEELAGDLKIAAAPLRKLNVLAEMEGLSVAQLALVYIRDMEGITSLVVGSETPEQVKENIILLETPQISERTRHDINAAFSNIPIKEIIKALSSRQ